MEQAITQLPEGIWWLQQGWCAIPGRGEGGAGLSLDCRWDVLEDCSATNAGALVSSQLMLQPE